VLDPVLKPRPADVHSRRALPLTIKIARAEIGILMDMLMRAGRSFEAAAKEVVRLLGENQKIFHGLPGNRQRIVERWRTGAMNSDDPDIKKMFNEHLEEVTRFLRDRDGGAVDLVRIVPMGPMPVRFQQRRGKRSKPNAEARCVSRVSKFGNPFKVEDHGQKSAYRLHREALLGYDCAIVHRELRGRHLGCYCAPGLPCHADTLLEIANAEAFP
jgi:hypothetical protein